MKKLISIVLCLILCVSLFSCNANNMGKTENTKASNSTKSPSTSEQKNESNQNGSDTNKNTELNGDTSSTGNSNDLEEKEYYLPEGYDFMQYLYGEPITNDPTRKMYDARQDYEIFDFVPPDFVEVFINGKTYVATYDKTFKFKIGPMHIFSDEEGNEFSVNAQNELIAAGFETDSIEGESISQEECEQKAKDFLSQIINVSNYRVTKVNYTSYDTICWVYFQKYIGEFPAYETVCVQVRRDGFVLGFSSEHLNQVPSDLELPDIDMDKVYSTIEYALNNYVYQRYHNKGHTDIKITLTSEPFICDLKSGEVGFVCEYSVHYGWHHDAGCYLFIRIPQT